MENLSNIITDLKEYNEIAKNLTEGGHKTLVCGVSHIHKANIVSAVSTQFNKQCLIITANDTISERLSKDIESFTDRKTLILKSREFIFHNIASSSKDIAQNRVETLYKMLDFNGVIIGTIDSLLQACIPKEILEKSVFSLEIGQCIDIKDLIQKLVNCGYTRSMQVEGVSQFSVRGGIVDIFPVSRKTPIRIEFFDDEIDTMTSFEIDTQRRKDNIEKIEILPASEVLPEFYKDGKIGLIKNLKDFINNDFKKSQELVSNIRKDIDRLESEGIFPTVDRYLTKIYGEIETPLDYLKSNAIVFFDDTQKVIEQSNVFFKRNSEDMISLIERGVIIGSDIDYFLDFASLDVRIRNKNIVMLDTFLQKNQYINPTNIINITAKQLPAYSGNIQLAKDDIKYYFENDYKVIVMCGSEARAKNMAEVLIEFKPKITNTPKGKLSIITGAISNGFEYPEIKIAVITEGQIIAKSSVKKARKSSREHVKSYTDLVVGDVVVHEHHGIGRFTGIEKIIVDGFEKDYVKIAFAGTDSLFVPATNLNLISKYIGNGGEDAKVRLNKLGGTDWQKAKVRAKSSAKDLAKYLTNLYAKRARMTGFAFNNDDVWQEDFENAFIFEETDDQLRSVSEIKKDMEKPVPMDRLLCGDVGFGKTEVALRAVMKCILSNKQAAILVPTTVLARQHYLTALQRFNGFPIKIEFISRFKTPKEEKNILERLKEGKIDLIIGTHKLFMKDMKFKDLGLLVIDEEQRFGVSHKEKLKELGAQIDVLTLSATPIPRTLNMALSGIRDMSVLEEAPHNRKPIETYVLEYDFHVIIDALRREILRNGQCFYLHNRVDSIDTVAYKIKMELPEANVEVAHGKMTQKQLSNIMAKMNDGEIDILVATTIIETGVDISNANTLIIENSDKMGLAQLHQIRGRVGRSNRTAYAYLTYQTGKVLSEIATKRLTAIREFAEFGSGFKIAMRDLEIRGAGNVLGPEQSGHLITIGYELYLKLLEEAVLEEKGEEKPKEIECVIELSIEANIDTKFIEDIGQRIDLYRRIAMIKTDENYHDMLDEIIDRYGEPTKSIVNLCEVSKIRSKACTLGITSISQKDNKLVIDFETPNLEFMTNICSKYNGKMMLSIGKHPYLTMKLVKNDNVLKVCNSIIDDMISIN